MSYNVEQLNSLAQQLLDQFCHELLEEGTCTFDTPVGQSFRTFIKLWEKVASHYGSSINVQQLNYLCEKAKRNAQTDFVVSQ